MSDESLLTPDALPPEQLMPYAHLIAVARRQLDLSVRDLAARITESAYELDKKQTTVFGSAVSRWESGTIAGPRVRRWVAHALQKKGLDISITDLDAAAQAQKVMRRQLRSHRTEGQQVRSIPANMRRPGITSATSALLHGSAHLVQPGDPEQPQVALQVGEPDHALLTSDLPYHQREVERRPFLKLLAMLGVASSDPLNSDLSLRLLHTLMRPSSIDPATADYMDSRASAYWHTWSGQSLPSASFLSFALEDLHRVTTLLSASLPTSIRIQLTSTAGSMALLTGALLWDLCSYSEARSYLRDAARAGHEANNPNLTAVAHGWLSFAWSYEAPTSPALAEALVAVQSGRTLRGARTRIQLWLAAVEAELHARCGNESACMTALRRAESSELLDLPAIQDKHWTHYDMTLLSGYKGACYLRLGKLRHAQQALREAISLATEQNGRVLPSLLTDLARVYAIDGQVEEACDQAHRVVDLFTTTGSRVKLERLYTVMDDLKPWSDAPVVRMLAERLSTVQRDR